MKVAHLDIVNVCIAFVSFCFCGLTTAIFFDRRKSYSLFSMLFVDVIMCAVFCACDVVYLFGIPLLLELNPGDESAATNQLIINICMSTKTFIFISGALLALDRTLLITFPIKYTKHLLSSKIVVLFLVVLPLTVGTVIVAVTNIEASDPFHAMRTSFIALMLAEMTLHLVFAVQFARFFKKQNTTNCTHQSQVNHITLFQMVCLTVFGLLPHAAVYVDTYYWHSGLTGGMVAKILEDICLLLNILVMSGFTFYKLIKRPAIVRVSHGTLHSKVRSTS